MKENKPEKFALVEHQTFKVLHDFDCNPNVEMIIEAVEKLKEKPVKQFFFLDMENMLFVYEDKKEDQFLLRNHIYLENDK